MTFTFILAADRHPYLPDSATQADTGFGIDVEFSQQTGIILRHGMVFFAKAFQFFGKS